MVNLPKKLLGITLLAGGALAMLVAANPLPEPVPYTFWLTGDSTDVQTKASPGLVLAGGGTDVNEAMRWLLARSGGGDVVVIRASGADGYNQYLFSELSVPINSVETIRIDSREAASHPEIVRKIRNAEALFIAGGDQANYLKFWKGTPTAAALNYLLTEKKVPVGGTSAGSAVLGRFYFTALHGTVQSEEALQNPYAQKVSIDRDDFLATSFLMNTFVDMHFTNRNRQGRLVTFLARAVEDWNLSGVRGVGIDEKTAICLDEHGTGTVHGSGSVTRFTVLKGPRRCEPGQPLDWQSRNGRALRTTRLTVGQRWDFGKWKGEGKAGYLLVTKGVLSESIPSELAR